MATTAPLAPLRAHKGQRLTQGLDDATVERLAKSHPDLGVAIAAAAASASRGRKRHTARQCASATSARPNSVARIAIRR